MPARLSVNAAAISLIAICILSAAILVAVTSSDHPAVVTAAAETAAASRPAVIQPLAPKPNSGDVDLPQPTATAGIAAPSAVSAASKPVTITGCLQQDGQAFRLTGTEGAQAPKSRSWKSGFLKKGNAAIAVVDARRRLNLSRHVNERVGVTGVLAGHSMQARAISRLAATC